MNLFFTLMLFGGVGDVGLRFSQVDNGPEIPQWNGFYIWYVSPDSPAAKAGILVNDQVMEINKRKVLQFSDLYSEMHELQVGDRVSFTLKRGSKFFSVELVAAPKEAYSEPSFSGKYSSYPNVVHPTDPWLDVELSEGLFGSIHLKRVGPSLISKLEKRDRILEVDQKEIKSVQQFYEVLKGKNPGEEIQLSLKRGGQKKIVFLKVQAWRDSNHLDLDWK